MRFGVLGQTWARREDGAEVSLGGPARRALLTLLLVRPNETVPADRLAEEIDPAGAVSAHAVQSQVSRLRAALGDTATIERVGAGYRLVVAPADVDAGRFASLAESGRAALRADDPAGAAATLSEALSLWRGPAYADVAETDSARAAAVRLEEVRLGAWEDRIEADLRCGRPVLAELRELVDRHPLRERLAGLLMRALYVEDGPAAALAAYEKVRRRLADELGADPSAELAALYRELLGAGSAPSPGRPPAPLTSFVGRTDDLTDVGALLTVSRLVTLVGPGGVGKTRLATELSARVDHDVCFVELAAQRDDAGVTGAMLAALGLRRSGLHADDAPQQPAERLAAALADRRLLLVLDNCEHLLDATAAVTARLLARCPRLRVLATSREPLGIIGEHLHPVGPLDDRTAVRLFADRAGAVRRGSADDPELARRVCATVDNLPLAIELVAARLRTLTLAELAARLDDRLGLAARRSRTADDRHQTLRTVVGWSWQLLSEPERQAAQRFSVFAGGAGAAAATRVCGTDDTVLEALVDRSLLTVSAGRFRMLDTIRAYAAEQLDAAGDGEALRRAHAEYVLSALRAAAPYLLRAEQVAWLPRLAADHDNLVAAVRWAVTGGAHDLALRLLAAAATYLWMRGTAGSLAPQAISLLDSIGDDTEEYAVCVLLAAADTAGRTSWEAHRDGAERALTDTWSSGDGGQYPAALLMWMMHNAADPDPGPAYRLVAAQHDRDDPWVRAVARYVTGFGVLRDPDPTRAEAAFGAAADDFRALGDRWGTILALDMLADLAVARGDRARAATLLDEALTRSEQLDAAEDTAELLVSRGDQRFPDDPEAARADYTAAAGIARRAGGTASLAAALRGLGDLALHDDQLDDAERRYADALERIDPHWIRSLGNRVRALAGLGRIADARGDETTARSWYREAVLATDLAGGPAPDVLRLFGVPADIAESVRAQR